MQRRFRLQLPSTVPSLVKYWRWKYKYLVLFMKRLRAGSAYTKSLRKSTLREIHYFFNSIPEFGGVIAVTNVPCWYWSTCKNLIFQPKLCAEDARRSEIIEETVLRPTSSHLETHLFSSSNYRLFEIDTNSYNPSFVFNNNHIFFFVQVLTVLILFLYFHTLYHYCMLVFL